LPPAESSIFRRAALDRLASPERLDERLALPRYPRALIVVAILLLVGVAGFAAWLLSAR
jgi:hypothetical protein